MNTPRITLSEPKKQYVSKLIPPNYSSWMTLELSYQCAKWVIDNNVPGCYVEAGIAAGNNLAAMCVAGRHGYGFDSFEGIPWAGDRDIDQPGIGDKDESKYGVLETSGVSSHSMFDVQANMKKWGISNYTLYKGWFQDTVKHFNRPISVLRLDGDLYESTYECMKHLYPKLVVGGLLLIDDWQLPGCRRAFYEYFRWSGYKMPELIFRNGPSYFQRLES